MQSQGQQLHRQHQKEQQRHQQIQHRYAPPQLMRRGLTIAPQALQQHSTDNTKEKCYTFLENLIYLSKQEPEPLAENVRNLIQDLVNANMEPEEFCDRLVRLIDARPQPNLVGFLKISLPLLRQALFRKELVIKDIRSPTQHVVAMSALTQQLPRTRLIPPYQVPIAVGRTTITKEQRIQSFTSAPGWPNTDMGVRYSALARTMQQQLHTNFPRLESSQSMGATIPGSGTSRGKANLASIGSPALMSSPNTSLMLSAPNFTIDLKSGIKILSETTFTPIAPATLTLLSTKTQGIE